MTEQDKMQTKANDILEYCNAFEIVDNDDAKIADNKIVECKALMKAIKLHHDPIIKAANQTHKLATAARKKLFDPPDQASKILGVKLANYAFHVRLEASQKQRVIDEKAKAEHDVACEKAAKEAEVMGEKGAAVALREMKSEPVVSEQLAEPVLMTKTKFKTDWEITAVFDGELPLEYMTINEAKILAMIRLNKGNIKIQGVEFKEIQRPIRRG